MTHSPARLDEVRLARLLFADLGASLDRALGAQLGVNESAEQRIDAEADALKSGEYGRSAFSGIAESEADRFDRAFSAAHTVASWLGIAVPTPEAFWAAGVDRAHLARALAADSTLMPVPAPYGLGRDRWVELFRAAARMPGSPLSLSAPLTLADDVTAAFSELDRAPRSATVVVTRDGDTRAQRDLGWSLRLIPAAATPPRTNLSYAFGPHPTLSELLMLQLMLLILGDELVDRHSFTWIHGTFGGDRFAARHFFDAVQRSVGVNTRETGNQGPHLGVRVPVG